MTVGGATLFAQGGGTKKVSIQFRPMVGAEPFACGRSYQGIGTSKETITPSDFAFYIYDAKLTTTDGKDVPVTLDQDGPFQNGTLALLDFTDGTGPCSNAGTLSHTAVTGTVPQGKYVGIRFTIGVPFERNHLDLTTQPSPLSLTRMFWAWNSGHKFVRFDAKTATGKTWLFHLGSTGCTPTTSPSTVPTTCAQPNRVAVTLPRFDVNADVIVADAGALFALSGGADNQVCMSSAKSAACAPNFAALGLPLNGSSPGAQVFLRAVPAGKPADAPKK